MSIPRPLCCEKEIIVVTEFFAIYLEVCCDIQNSIAIESAAIALFLFFPVVIFSFLN